MPLNWHDRRSVNKMKDEDGRDFYRAIVADRKPYFMKYIYPSLMKQYNTYTKNTNKNAMREFGMDVSELKSIPYDNLTERQKEFLSYYDKRMPVGVGDCVMNKICHRFESEFDGYVGRKNSSTTFDYTIMKSDAEYTTSQYNLIKHLYEDYNRRLSNYNIFISYERVEDFDSTESLNILNTEFRKECEKICPDEKALCNIILDICYTRNATKRFAWNMCGAQIIRNLLEKNDNTISFPTLDDSGGIEFCGNTFSMDSIILEETN